jgi:hypothetical protein
MDDPFEVEQIESLDDGSAECQRLADRVGQAGKLSFPGGRTKANGQLRQAEHRPGVASCVHGRSLLRDRMDNAKAAHRGALARDCQPAVLAAEPVERSLAEPLASAMAEQHEAVVRLDAWGIVGELEGRDRPGVNARASQQGLPD